jgi:hypothetical protein
MGVLVGLGLLAGGCSNADLPEEPKEPAAPAASGGAWATQVNAACTEVAASSEARPTSNAGGGAASGGVALLTWHQNLAYTLASRLQALPDAPSTGQEFVSSLREVGTATEDLITQVRAKPVDADKRQRADAERSAAIGKAAALSAQLGLDACTPLAAGG